MNKLKFFLIQCKKVFEGNSVKDYIEERAIDIANYIIDNNATVRQTARQFGISKSTVHMVVTKQNVLCGRYSECINMEKGTSIYSRRSFFCAIRFGYVY